MQERWYYLQNGQQAGPELLPRLRQFAASGKLRANDILWKAGGTCWVAAVSVPGLFPKRAEGAVAGPCGIAERIAVGKALAIWRSGTPWQKVLIGVGLGALVLIAIGIPVLLAVAGGRATPVDNRQAGGTAAGQTQNRQSTQQANPGGNAGLDPRLIATWHLENHATVGSGEHVFVLATHRYITIGADGRFTDKTESGGSHRDGTVLGDGVKQGRVTQQGNTLTFRYDNGTVWTPNYRLEGSDGVRFNGGEIYLRR
jgi:hypothetical protein